MKNKLAKVAAKGTVSVLNKFLNVEANSASSILAYQPKEPKVLARYRRTK